MSKKRSLKLRRSEAFSIEQTDGSEKEYYLQDMNGEQRDEFVDYLSTKVQRGPDGAPLPHQRDDVGVNLCILSRTLYEAETGKLVSKEKLKKWPHELLEDLAKEATELCGLTTKSEAAEGNG